MAEPDAAGHTPTSEPEPRASKGSRSLTLANVQREMKRATEPLRAAQRAAAAFAAPVMAAAKAHERVLAPLREMERQRRAIQAQIDAAFAAANPFLEIKPETERGGFSEWCDREILREWREMEGWGPPPKASPASAPAAPAHVAIDHLPGPISDAQLEALVVRVADELFRRVAATSTARIEPPKGKSRRGRKRREISVGGVDAALEALAAEDPNVMALSARVLADRLGNRFAYTTIQKSPTYKRWRKALAELRTESKAFGVSDLFEAGLTLGTRKPGRRRLADPTIDPEMEARTRAFLKAHEGEGLGGD